MQTTTSITPEIYAICLAYATARCNARRYNDRYQHEDARTNTYIASRLYANERRDSWPALEQVKAALGRRVDLTDPQRVLEEAGIVAPPALEG